METTRTEINYNVRVPTWLWVTVAIWFAVKALAVAQHIVWVMGPRGGVG